MFIFIFILVIPSGGSSRTTGGFLRGQALGNTMNIGDLDLSDDSDCPNKNKQLIVYLYFQPTDAKPHHFELLEDPILIRVMHTRKLALILSDIAKIYSQIECMVFIFLW